jgi:hypothetical protein
MSQRAVAEITRNKFGLKKFSHSTVCRIFKALEESIEKVSVPGELYQDPAPGGGQRFPSVTDTAGRRRFMSAFLKGLYENNTGEIDEISCNIVIKWYDRYMRLLI